MRNQVFITWFDEESQEFTLPAMNQGLLDALPDSTNPRVFLDLIDVWHQEEVRGEIGNERAHFTVSNGTHVLISEYDGGRKYVIAWHPTEQDIQRETVEAVATALTCDVYDEDETEESDLVREIAQKHKIEEGL